MTHRRRSYHEVGGSFGKHRAAMRARANAATDVGPAFRA